MKANLEPQNLHWGQGPVHASPCFVVAGGFLNSRVCFMFLFALQSGPFDVLFHFFFRLLQAWFSFVLLGGPFETMLRVLKDSEAIPGLQGCNVARQRALTFFWFYETAKWLSICFYQFLEWDRNIFVHNQPAAVVQSVKRGNNTTMQIMRTFLFILKGTQSLRHNSSYSAIGIFW